MRKLIIMGLMAATMAPVAAPAVAQTRGEVRRDREQLREERGELRDARRHGDRRDVREERRDVREAGRELRQDRRDWRQYRQSNRRLYSRGDFHSPFAYRTFRPGLAIGAGYYGSRFVISDPYRYRLPAARPGLRWVRHYDDVLLVDVRRGRVVEVIRNFFW
jgi:Ni/Co efflux regulator RcnB